MYTITFPCFESRGVYIFKCSRPEYSWKIARWTLNTNQHLIVFYLILKSDFENIYSYSQWQSLNMGPRFYLRLIRRTGWLWIYTSRTTDGRPFKPKKLSVPFLYPGVGLLCLYTLLSECIDSEINPAPRGCAGGRIGTRFLRPSPLKGVNPAGTPGYRNGTESFFDLKRRPSVEQVSYGPWVVTLGSLTCREGGNLSTWDLGFIYVSFAGRVGCEFLHPAQPTDAPPVPSQ
jgi:hypothetical protein